MTPEEQIEQIDISIEQAQDAVSMQKALDELSRNRNFKKVIQEGFFKTEAQRAVLLKSDPSMQSDDDQKSIDNIILAIGQLRQYFIKVNHLGRMATQAITDNEEEKDMLLNEEA